jgi:hypothetical protein
LKLQHALARWSALTEDHIRNLKADDLDSIDELALSVLSSHQQNGIVLHHLSNHFEILLKVLPTFPNEWGIDIAGVKSISISNVRSLTTPADFKLDNAKIQSLSEHFPSMFALSSLNVMKNLVGNDRLAALMMAVKGTTIKSITGIIEGQTSIDWSGQDLKPCDMKILAADIEFTPFSAAIRLLNISGNKCFGNYCGYHATPGRSEYTEDGWTTICDALKCTQIETLDISDIGLTSSGLTTFSNAMSAIATLSEVNLSGATIEEGDLAALRSAAPNVSFVY